MKTPVTLFIVLLFASAALATPLQRREINSWSPQEIEEFKSAIAQMQARSRINPGDHLGYTYWANLHHEFCNSSQRQIHFGMIFLPWHRGYLFYFERALQKASGNASIRLPYWDWNKFRNPPAAFFGPNNPLAETNRGLTLQGKLADADVDVREALSVRTFAEFGGDKISRPGIVTTTGMLEAGAHGNVHTAIGGPGGDMSAFKTAARDPLFWLHHANLDRLWDVWVSRGNQNPSSPAWLDHKFTFFDQGTPVTLNIRELMQQTANTYMAAPADIPAASPADTIASGPKFPVGRPLIFKADTVRRQPAPQGVNSARVRLRSVAAPVASPVTYHIFLDRPEATESTPTTDAGFAGKITLLPVELAAGESPPLTDIVVPARATASQLLLAARPVGVTVVAIASSLEAAARERVRIGSIELETPQTAAAPK